MVDPCIMWFEDNQAALGICIADFNGFAGMAAHNVAWPGGRARRHILDNGDSADDVAAGF